MLNFYLKKKKSSFTYHTAALKLISSVLHKNHNLNIFFIIFNNLKEITQKHPLTYILPVSQARHFSEICKRIEVWLFKMYDSG